MTRESPMHRWEYHEPSKGHTGTGMQKVNIITFHKDHYRLAYLALHIRQIDGSNRWDCFRSEPGHIAGLCPRLTRLRDRFLERLLLKSSQSARSPPSPSGDSPQA